MLGCHLLQYTFGASTKDGAQCTQLATLLFTLCVAFVFYTELVDPEIVVSLYNFISKKLSSI